MNCINNSNTQNFIEKAKLVHGDKYDYSEVNYVRSCIKVKIFCKKCNEYFWQTPNNHLSGRGCEKCSYKLRSNNRIKKAADIFIERAKKIHGDLYNYSLVNYQNAKHIVKIICNKCQKIFYQTPNNHLRGQGCSYCNGNHKKDLQYFINKATQIHGNIYDYSEIIYKNNRIPVKIKCKKCNKYFYQDLGNHIYQKQGCPYCTSSWNEKLIAQFLDNNKIFYEKEKKFKDCKDRRYLPFDFYLPKYNCCIEFQGKQHYQEGFDFYLSYNKNDLEKAKCAFYTLQKHDEMKREYCKNNNIKLLEIKYDENVENILYKNFVE